MIVVLPLCPPLAGKPGHDVRDLLRREGLPGHVFAPVWLAEIWTTDDHGRSKRLITHQSQERGVDDRACLRTTLAVRSVAARAGARVYRRAGRVLVVGVHGSG